MAKGKKTGGKNFQKGISGNPKGRPKLPEDLKAALRMSKERLQRAIIEMGGMTDEELNKIDQTHMTLEERFIAKSYAKCDYNAIDKLWNRAFGKPVDSHRLVTEDGEDAEFKITFVDKISNNDGL